MVNDATEQHRLRWKCETELATLRVEVERVRDEMNAIRYTDSIGGGYVGRLSDTLTRALIDAAGEQVPSVPLSVDDLISTLTKYADGLESERCSECGRAKYAYLDSKSDGIKIAIKVIKRTLAPHRAAPPAASEPVCETCEDKHAITCDDYRECINPEKCAWGKVCKDGVFPCPDCATAPRTPTVEQRAAFLHKSGGYYNRAVTIIANVFSGNRDTEVTAWLAEREGGGDDERLDT